MHYSQLTYSGVLLAVFANQLCLPVPSVVFLMAAGALSAHGKMSAGLLAALSIVPCLVADGLWFWFGRRWGPQALRVLCRFTADPHGHADRAQRHFHRYGLPSLLVSKFLPGLDGLIPPLAGAEGVSLPQFLAVDAMGSLLWSAAYVAVGYVFAGQLDVAIEFAKNFGRALAIAVALPIFLYAAWRGLALLRMIRAMRVRSISPSLLHRKLQSNVKVAVLDLLDFDDEVTVRPTLSIPGALRIDPARLRSSGPITVPDDVQIVLYCSSRRDIMSARVAMALKNIGIDNVWVLEGGLQSWREKGYPVTESIEPPDVVADRFGVKLPA